MDQLAFDPRQHYWDRLAGSYDRSVRMLGGAMPALVERISSITKGCSRVLEVGAGTGLVTRALAGSARQVVATDYSRAMVQVLVQRVEREGWKNVKCLQMDLYALPGELGTFDAVVAANVLHLVPDLPRALDALGRSLKPGGMLMVPTYCHEETVVARMVSQVLALGALPAQRRFRSGTLVQAVEAAGYSVRRLEILDGLLPIGLVVGQKGGAVWPDFGPRPCR